MQNIRQNILSTRPLNKQIIEDAAEKNIFIDCISFIETEPIANKEVKEKIGKLSTEKITAVFTSMNAVEAVKENLASKPEWRIFSIGQTTKELVADFFGPENIVATANDANTLADVIIEKDAKDIFFFCGDQRRDELPQKLKLKNINLEEVIVYHTIIAAHKISKDYDGILFYSPSAVESFFLVNTINENAVLFAIGYTTSNALKKFIKNKIIIAEQPGKEALVKKMVEYFSIQKQVN